MPAGQSPQAEVAADPRQAPHQRRHRTRPPLPLAVFWPRGALYCKCSTNSSFNGTVRHAEWWSFSSRAIAALIRSCRSNERRRRSLLRLAEPEVTRSTFMMSTVSLTVQATQTRALSSQTALLLLSVAGCVVLLFVCC